MNSDDCLMEIKPAAWKEEADVISYEPFWEMMREKGISGYALVNTYGLCKSEVRRLKQGHNFNIFFIDHLCTLFDCDIQDIAAHVRTGGERNQK